MDEGRRDSVPRRFRVAAVLFGLLAVSNLLKPLELNEGHGFVFLGQRLQGTANLVAGSAFGLFLAVYVAGLWQARRFALSLGLAYAAWVPVNLHLFRAGLSPEEAVAYPLFSLVYKFVAIGVSSGTALVLLLRRDRLR